MLNLASKLDLVKLREAVSILPLHKDGTGVLMAFGPCDGVAEVLKEAADEIGLLRGKQPTNAMVVVIPPGHSTGAHVDPGPRYERWHLPLVTNDKCFYQDEALNTTHMSVGFWWGPVEFWQQHEATNDGAEERVHIIVDLL